MNGVTSRRQWRWAIPAVAIITLLTVYPLVYMPLMKRGDWQGSFPYLQPDELPYAAYLNAIAAGYSRRNNPYTGAQDRPGVPLAESSYSIQFPPAYALATVKRIFGLSTSATFAVVMVVASFASALALFWLLVSVNANERLAATGVVFVLCLGGVLTLWGLLQILRGLPPDFTHLRFTRRYVPALALPLLFAFCNLVWRMLTIRRALWISVLLASLAFTALVFSYFYYWTAALAWLACVALLWLLARPVDWRPGMIAAAALAVISFVALLPYWWLMKGRAPNQEVVNLLVHTHAPDLFRVPEAAGFVLLIVVLFCGRRWFHFSSHECLFATSFLVWPFLLFNQQIITGLSLQPVHYEVFVANYGILVAIVFIAGIFRQQLSTRSQELFQRMLPLVAVIAIAWAMFEVHSSTEKYTPAFRTRDDATPAANYLAKNRIGVSRVSEQIILATDPVVADYLPTVISQPVLWAPHMDVFAGVTVAEDQLRLSQLMYYTGVHFDDRIDANRFAELDPERKMYFTRLMGRSRTDRSLTVNWKPIAADEYSRAQDGYENFVAAFNRDQAAQPLLSYALSPSDRAIDFSHLDRWYERTEQARCGRFILYRLKLRD